MKHDCGPDPNWTQQSQNRSRYSFDNPVRETCFCDLSRLNTRRHTPTHKRPNSASNGLLFDPLIYVRKENLVLRGHSSIRAAGLRSSDIKEGFGGFGRKKWISFILWTSERLEWIYWNGLCRWRWTGWTDWTSCSVMCLLDWIRITSLESSDQE